jgi:hypothetical protein
MWRIYAIIALVWVALLPPLFTGGSCTAQFEGESSRLQANIAQLRTVESAERYWAGWSLPVATLSVDQCGQSKPRFLSRCGSGPFIYIRVPVENQVCRLYRDSEIKIQLQYDELGRLSRMATDMNPFKSFPVPFTSIVVHWAR